MTDMTFADVVDYWYQPEVKKRWFNSTPAFDSELKNRFLNYYATAVTGELDHWQNHALGSLALVILFDQIPLNIFRGGKKSFATEARSREVARHAINSGQDKQLTKEQLVFLYMPFMHSENLADQDYSVELFSAAGLEENLRFARHHRGIIERFGRFPHRNKILGRESTEDEKEYLASKEAFHG